MAITCYSISGLDVRCDRPRLDPAAGRIEYLGCPLPCPRMPGLVLVPDDRLSGTRGDDGHVKLFADHRAPRRRTMVADVATREAHSFRPPDLALRDGVCCVGETDNPERAGYLREVPL